MRRTASAALVLAALLALLTSPSLHAHPSGTPAVSPAVTAVGAAGFAADNGGGAPPHDASLCPICRAIAQGRLALRAPACASSLLLASASLRLQLAAPDAPAPAPALESGAPRGPPASSAIEA